MPEIVPSVVRDQKSDQLIADAAEMARDASDSSRLIGYIVLGMYSDGSGRTAGWRPNTTDHQIGTSLWRAWASRALEDHFMRAEGVDATYSVLNGEA